MKRRSPSWTTMDSSSGHEESFIAGERVLCYEPDPTKVRVVYDAKILRVAKGEKKKKKGEDELFLVHFQGWNSSWDRFVSRDFLLKDIEENRSLQKDLFKQTEEYVRGKRKKKRRTGEHPVEGEGTSTPEGKVDKEEEKTDVEGPKKEEEEENQEDKGAIDSQEDHDELDYDDEGVDDSPIPVPLSDDIMNLLNFDHNAINARKKLHRLPAEKSAVRILEDFVRAFGSERLSQHEKNFCRSNVFFVGHKRETARENLVHILDEINLAKEVAEGLRVLVDFYVGSLLLYKGEKEQYSRMMGGKKFEDYFVPADASVLQSLSGPGPTAETPTPQSTTAPSVFSKLRRSTSRAPSDATSDPGSGRSSPACSSSTVAAATMAAMASIVGQTSLSVGGGGGGSSGGGSTSGGGGSGGGDTAKRVAEERSSLSQWTLLPPSVAERAKGRMALASTVYGPVFLVRLMVKMPHILGKMRPGPKKTKLLLKYFALILAYLEKTVNLDDSCYE